MTRVKKIVIRVPNWLGDAVMAFDALVSIRRHYADAKIVILCKAPLSKLFMHSPFVDQVYDIDVSRRFCIRFMDAKSVRSWLCEQKFCLGILLTNSFSSALLFKRGGVKNVIGYRRFFSSYLLTSSLKRSKKGLLHMSEYYQRLTDLEGIARSSFEKFIRVEGVEIQNLAARFNLPKQYVVLCPTSAFGPAKCWPLDYCILLAKKLIDKGLFVVIAAEKKIDFLIEHRQLLNLGGKTTLREFIVLLHEAKVVVANDSGPLHLASHMRIPLVCLFGSSPVEQAKPYVGASVFYKHAACSPCFKRVCPIDFHCMKQIHVDEVYDALMYQYTRFTKIAVAIFAGGLGQRLGSNTPKAVLDFDGTCLLRHHIEQIPIEVKVFILTSDFTYGPIKQYLEKHAYFGRTIMLYSNRSLSATHLDGSSCDERVPEGNGAFYDCIVKSGFFEKYREVEVVNCIPIDNPKAKPYCLDLIHACLELKKEAAFSCVSRTHDDPIGLLLEKGRGLEVIEYMNSQIKSYSGQENQWGFINLFCVRKDFIIKASKKEFTWNRVERGAKFHFERWIFDPFDLISSYKVFTRNKKNYFYPLKSKDDLDTVRSILYNGAKNNIRV